MASLHAEHLDVHQTTCLTEAIYFESRGEGIIGERAVAYVVLNRTIYRHESICDVIHQKNQFSFYHPDHYLHVYNREAWQIAAQIAVNTQLGIDPNPINNATYYNTTPMYIHHTVMTRKIRHQYFYTSISYLRSRYKDVRSSSRPHHIKQHHGRNEVHQKYQRRYHHRYCLHRHYGRKRSSCHHQRSNLRK